MDARLTIQGLQEAQDQNARAIAALKPSSGLGRAVKYATIEAHRYLVSIVHVDTGAYRAANRMEIRGDTGRIYVDPGARNPRSKIAVAAYAAAEEKRGGSHAAYSRTVKEKGSEISGRAVRYLEGQLP